MRVITNEQGTQEWLEARAGKITASDARFALAKRGGKGRRLYTEKLADDIEGIPDFATVETEPWFAAGRYYESYARGWYSFAHDIDVVQTGLVVHDDYPWLGCSPDGLVGDDGLVEIKYRKRLSTFYQHKARGYNNQVMAQIQTQLFVTDRKWCDYVNYWRDDDNEWEKGAVERLYKDQAYIENTLLPAFLGLWCDVQKLLKKRGVV